MKRTTKLLSLLLAIVFVVSLLPTFALADEKTVSTEEEFTSAITDATAGDTIKLLAAVTLTSTIDVSKTLTIDLNGNSITGESCRVFKIAGGTLTLDGTGTISSTHIDDDSFGEGSSVILVAGTDADAKLIVKSGVTISSAWCYGITLFGAAHTQELDVYGTVSTTGIKSAIADNGRADFVATTINIFPGATVTAENSSAVYHPQAGTLTITGGTITGTTAVEAESGTVSISDNAKLTATGTSAGIGSTAEDGAIASGYALAVINRAGYKGNVVATISGGEFKGAVGIAKAGEGSDKTYSLSITNGSFTDLVNAVKYAASGATIKLLANVELPNEVVITQALTLDLNGHQITRSADEDLFWIHSNGSLELTGTGAIKNTMADGSVNACAIYVGSTLQGKGTLTVGENVTLEGTTGVVIVAYGSSMTSSGTITGRTDFGISGNGQPDCKGTSINITGGSVSGGAVGVYHPQIGTLNITGGSITGGSGIEIKGGTATISGADIAATTTTASHEPSGNGNSTSGYAVAVVENSGYAKDESKVSASITGGKFNGPVARLVDSDRTGDEILAVSGGYFTHDPSEHLDVADNYAAKPTTMSGYNFEIGVLDENVEVGPTLGDVAAPPSSASAAVTAVYEALVIPDGGGVNASDEGFAGAVGAVAESTAAVTSEQLAAKGITVGQGQTVTTYVAPVVDIEIAGVEANDTKITSITLDIEVTAMVYATTAEDIDGVAFDGVDKNAAVISEAPLTVTTPIALTIAVPSNYEYPESVQIKHVKGDGRIYYYAATIGEDESGKKYLSFTVEHGFSTLEMMAADTRTLTVNYDSSVAAGIYNITDVGGALSTATPEPGYSFSGWKFYSDDAYATALTGFTGTYTTLPDIWSATEVEDDITVFAKAQFSPLPGPSEKTYNVTVSAAENGKVTADKTRAAEGATVTLTIAPAEGFELDALTVQDKDGKAVAVENNAFKMPASDVTVTAAFIWKNPYSDVKAADWFYDAVKYVTEKGLFEGDGGKFDPNGPMNRAMMVTVLWRMEGSPEAAACAFEDVPADQWYYAAVCWAAEKKVVEGYDAKTFAPLDPITREQMVTMLYNYAVYKGLAAKPEGAMGMAGFTDAGEIHDWAYDAMQWAVLTGLVEGDNGLLSPRAGATRAQVATLLMRYCETILK